MIRKAKRQKPPLDCYENADYGICKLSLKGNVICQNKKSREICGVQRGPCVAQLFRLCRKAHDLQKMEEGMYFFRNEKPRGTPGIFDLCGIRTKKSLEIHFYDVNSKYLPLLDELIKENLSKKEFEVARLKILGKSHSSICSMLDITENTLKTHLRNIRVKLPSHIKALADSLTKSRK